MLAIATAGSVVGRSRAMPSDAPWGDTWSDGSGALASEVRPLAIFYDCTIVGDHIVYASMADCNSTCHAGTCERRTADGNLSTPELVTLHPNTAHERDAVMVALSPVIPVGGPLEMVIRAVDSSLTISVQEDPGLPIGMSSSLNTAQSELTVSWTPRVGQEGTVHEVRFQFKGQIHCRAATFRKPCRVQTMFSAH